MVELRHLREQVSTVERRLDVPTEMIERIMFTFLQLNGLEVIAAGQDYYITMMALASGQMNREQLTDWLRTAVNGTLPDVTAE
jgi:hypothetical protein